MSFKDFWQIVKMVDIDKQFIIYKCKQVNLSNVDSYTFTHLTQIMFTSRHTPGCFYGISTIVSYLMPNPLYTYILNMYDLVCLGFRAYQPL